MYLYAASEAGVGWLQKFCTVWECRYIFWLIGHAIMSVQVTVVEILVQGGFGYFEWCGALFGVVALCLAAIFK